jgi:hypothetical protein
MSQQHLEIKQTLKHSRLSWGNFNASNILNSSIFSSFTFIRTIPFFTQIFVSAVLIKGLPKMIGKGDGIGDYSISNTMKSAGKIN